MSHGLKKFRVKIETNDPEYYGKKKLRIRGKDLANLPKSVFSLLDLYVLELSPDREACLAYKLGEVPPEIGQLVNLRILILDTNELTEIPMEITLLENLERLTLSNNSLTSLPEKFANLAKLRSLHLANNMFSEFPDQICELKSLEFLDLSDNSLSVLPEAIGKLSKLETLLMFANRLAKLPDSICQLEQLRCVWLGKNCIKQLPRDFGNLTKLNWDLLYTSSVLDNNPLTRPPLEICRLGARAINRYMSGNSPKQRFAGDRSDRAPEDTVQTNTKEINGY